MKLLLQQKQQRGDKVNAKDTTSQRQIETECKESEASCASEHPRNRKIIQEAERGDIKWRSPEWNKQGPSPSAKEARPLSPKSFETLSYEEFCARADSEPVKSSAKASGLSATGEPTKGKVESLHYWPGCFGEVEVEEHREAVDDDYASEDSLG